MYTKLTLINMLTFASTTIFDLCIKFKHTLDIVVEGNNMKSE